jgi:hypothetical protein
MHNRIVRRLAFVLAFIIAAAGITITPAHAALSPAGPAAAVKGYPGKTVNSTRSLLGGPYFFYGIARQVLAAGESATSLAANLHVQNTYLDTTNDAHTLGELAVQSHDSKQIVEVGWNRDDAVCGAGNTCLFVFRWKDGVPTCYNLCAGGAFVEYAAACSVAGTICAGDNLSPHFNTTKRFQIIHSGSAWWIAYDGHWIGYYPDTVNPTFTSGGLFQVFYEVATKATGDNTPCTDMGNGRDGATDLSAARMGSISMTGTAPGAIANNFTASTQPSTAVYTATALSATTTRAGGPGYNPAGTGVGTRGSC